MFNASQQLQQIRNRLNGTSVGDETLRPTQQVLLQAQQALLNAQIEQQRKSLEGNTILQDTLQKQRDYVTAWSNRLEHQLQLLQEAVNSKRLTLTEKTAQEAVTPDETARIQANPLVKQELDINHQLSEKPVSYTHLDVYKRQHQVFGEFNDQYCVLRRQADGGQQTHLEVNVVG